jgi:hypothetical protein
MPKQALAVNLSDPLLSDILSIEIEKGEYYYVTKDIRHLFPDNI